MELFIVLEEGNYRGVYRFNSQSAAKSWIKLQKTENPGSSFYLYKRMGV